LNPAAEQFHSHSARDAFDAAHAIYTTDTGPAEAAARHAPRLTNDALSSIPVWPARTATQADASVESAALQVPTTGTVQMACEKAAPARTSQWPVVDVARRQALLRGMNIGPGSLFPIVASEAPAMYAELYEDMAPAARESILTNPTNAPAASLNGQAAPGEPVPTQNSSVQPVQRHSVGYGMPQYPASSRGAVFESGGSLPQTNAVNEARGVDPSASFQAIP
jgi:hypothetical protein